MRKDKARWWRLGSGSTRAQTTKSGRL